MIIPAVRRRLDMVRNDGLRGIDYIEHAVVCPRLDLDGDDVSDLIAHFGCCGHDIYGRIFQVLHFDERFLVESQGRGQGYFRPRESACPFPRRRMRPRRHTRALP